MNVYGMTGDEVEFMSGEGLFVFYHVDVIWAIAQSGNAIRRPTYCCNYRSQLLPQLLNECTQLQASLVAQLLTLLVAQLQTPLGDAITNAISFSIKNAISYSIKNTIVTQLKTQ
jgi:hypothetical protein